MIDDADQFITLKLATKTKEIDTVAKRNSLLASLQYARFLNVNPHVRFICVCDCGVLWIMEYG